MPEGDPGHQFQMLLKPIANALRAANVEAALRFAGHLFDIGGPAEHQDRKVHVLLRAMEGATPSVAVEFRTKLLERYGAQLQEQAKARLASPLDRL